MTMRSTGLFSLYRCHRATLTTRAQKEAALASPAPEAQEAEDEEEGGGLMVREPGIRRVVMTDTPVANAEIQEEAQQFRGSRPGR